MTTNASDAGKRQPEVPMGDLAKDVGLEHNVKSEQAPSSVRRAIGKLFGRVQSPGSKKR
jgi:hypothetical protein